METNSTERADNRYRSGSKLRKDPPPALSSRYSLRKPQSNASLRRHPSAPVYPHSQTPASSSSRDHQRTRSNAYDSSNSSLDQQIAGGAGPSPILGGSHLGLGSASYNSNNQPNRSPTHRLSTQDDLVGPPFDAKTVITTIDSSRSENFPPALRRPPPPQVTHTSPDPRGLRFLRTSTSFTKGEKGMEVTPPRSDNSGTISPKRLSDETGKFAPPLRKRTGFSNFVNSMLGSPRTIKISAPENPVHMIHVGYDNQTGQFTVSVVPMLAAAMETVE